MSKLKTTIRDTFSDKMRNEFIASAIERHDVYCNQKYSDRFPYSSHLRWVAKVAERFLHLIEDYNDKNLVLAGAYGHDMIEDARLTYSDIKSAWGVELAEIIYACTEDKGRNRSARHGADYFMELSKNDLAIFVKLCDIAANITYSILDGSGMLKKYKDEWKFTREYLYTDKYKELFEYIDRLLTVVK